MGLAASAWAVGSDPGECVPAGPGHAARCLYRSLLPSTGIVADCESDTRCRVGVYYGSPDAPTPFAVPAGWDALPRPHVFWHGATFAEARFERGVGSSVSYFVEARRRRVSPPRADVLAVDSRRSLVAQVEERAVEIVQIFAGRPVARIERPWAPGLAVREAVTAIHFDADARITFTWLAGPERRPVTERVTVPSIPPSND